MKGRLIDLTFGMDGKQRITVTVDEDFRETWDNLHDADVSIEIKKYRKRRSLDANAMMWEFCSKIAEATGTTKEEVYRHNIREVGQYTPLPIREDAVEEFSRIWSEHGTGWFVEVVDDSKIEGYKLVFAYHGSSCYDTKQMSRLIDNVLQDAKSIGIETMSERERSLMMDAWTPR
ncbi:MAG: hypothetical protein Q4D04_15600 [Clostridia bacterium]|nr:hypothetical protein [Clostridia bacterium]